MSQWRGYFIISRITANLGDANWIALIELVRQIQANGGRTEYELQERGNLDTFEEVIDENNSIWWSNQYIYEARYQENAVSFDKFADKLSEAFGVPIEEISYTTDVDAAGNVYATYVYAAVNRFRIALMGCANDIDLCSWQTSRDATNAHIIANDAIWNGEQ